MNNNFQNDIQSVNQTFDDMISNFKTNYVNFNTNAMLLLPSSPPPSSTDSLSSTPGSTPTSTNTSTTTASLKNLNDDALQKYRYAANQVLEKVRSQIALNSKNISNINADITPIQKIYLQIMEMGTGIDQTKSASVVSLEDFHDLYRVTVFGTIMYVIGAGVILYLLYKPQVQSKI